MRKSISASVLIITGLIILFFTFFKNNKVEYTENIFSEKARLFDKVFTQLINDIDRDIADIKSAFKDDRIQDTLTTRKFFLNKLKESSFINSIAYFQDNYKIAVIKEKKSLVYSIDSTREMDIVKWNRYKKGTLISSWNESFEKSISNMQWYTSLLKHKDQLSWFFKENDSLAKKTTGDTDKYYLGYSFEEQGKKNVILFGISRQALKNEFEIKGGNMQLIIENIDGELLKMNSINNLTTRKRSETGLDSLALSTLSHYKNFRDQKNDIFRFNYKGEPYWNSFKKFSKKSGLEYYIFTMPENVISSGTADSDTDWMKWIGILSVLLGLILMFLKKQLFYFPKKIKIPAVKALLNGDENRYLEFKSSSRWDYRQEKYNPELENVIYKTIAAFGNTDGGTLLIGVDDDKNIIGLEKDLATLKKPNTDFYEIHLRNNLHKFMGVKNVSKDIRIDFEICDHNHVVCKIIVLPFSEPIFIKTKDKNGNIAEKFYVRSGNSSQEIRSMIEINDYINSRFKK